VATLKATETPPSIPTLEGKTTFEPFLLKQSRWLKKSAMATATTLTHLLPAFLLSHSGNCSRETAARLHRRLLIMAHTISAVS
jgi:hypothetical protein